MREYKGGKVGLAEAAEQVLALRAKSSAHGFPSNMLAMQTINRRKASRHLNKGPNKPLPPLPTMAGRPQAALRPKEFDRLCLDMIKLPQIRAMLNTSSTFTSTTMPRALSSTMPNLHRSLCITDPKLNGNPIRFRSNYFSLGPRGLKVGECEFLNLPPYVEDGSNTAEHCSDGVIYLSTRASVNGHPTFVLEFAHSLISEESGRPTYVMASQIDITRTIWRLADMWLRPRPNRISTHSQVASVHDAQHMVEQAIVTKKDSGVHLDEASKDNINDTSVKHDEGVTSPIDWLSPSLQARASTSPPSNATSRSALVPTYITTPFAALIAQVRAQHKDYFLLAPSSTRPNGKWQIAYTSPSLHAKRVDARVAFGTMNITQLQELGSRLAGIREVQMDVKWGVDGKERELKCIPMVSGSNGEMGNKGRWLCFLL